MHPLLKSIRGLLGLGTIGALAGGGLMAAFAAVVELIAGGAIIPEVIGITFVFGAGLGFATTTAFGLALAFTSRGHRLEELSFWRATSVAAGLGALLPPALVALGVDAVSPRMAEAPSIVISALFGAFLGGGLVAIGKHARLREIEATGGEDRLIEP